MAASTMVDVEMIEKIPPSCSECRKAKRKCDRSSPCSACVKARLSCTYERIRRTPLTRKYLSEVEIELAKTKALLEKYQSQPTPAPSDPSVRPRPSTSSASNVSSASNPRLTLASTPPTADPSSAGHKVSPNFSIETPPAGELDWDERGANSSVQLNDGMASLLDRNGYMGPTSGSALLRLADDGGNGDALVQVSSYEVDRISPPITPALFDLAQLEPYIDSYFATYHISYPIVHEPTFRAQFMEIIPRPHGRAWHVLLHIVAAIGCFASSETQPESDLALFDAAKQRLSIDMLETGNLTLVQALVLISNYIQKRNRPNSGYNYMGLAKRMAWGLALHKEFPAWREQPFRMEQRRRVWHCLAVFDQGAVITFSRPLDMPSSGIEVELPMNINDSDLTSSSSKTPEEREATTLYTHIRVQSTFHLATNGIYQKLISAIPTARDMLRFDETYLQTWVRAMPEYYREDAPQILKHRLSHAIMQWRWRNFRILMMRPYLMRRFMKHRNTHLVEETPQTDESEETAINMCLSAAKDTIHMINHFWRTEQHNVLACWYALYFLFQAVLIPVISLRNDSRSPLAPQWRDDVLLALEIITDMNRINPAAARCHAAIINLCGAYLAMDISQWESPTNESPQTQMNTLYSYMFGPIMDNQLFDPQGLQMQESNFMDFMGQFGAP